MGGFEYSLHISPQFRQYPLSAAVPQINNKWQGFCEEQNLCKCSDMDEYIFAHIMFSFSLHIKIDKIMIKQQQYVQHLLVGHSKDTTKSLLCGGFVRG